MRVNELCNLRVEDLDFEHGYIHVEVAKGDRPRTVVSPKPTLEALHKFIYMAERPDSCF
jgi:integrase/recombinase XerD